ncbi:hypothetical protein RQP46_001487 [Phenoliferia psychrophenolica]
MPNLPPEIIDPIISQVALGAREDLLACALTSKLLLPFAREHLYKSIRIRFNLVNHKPDERPPVVKVHQLGSQVLLLATLKQNGAHLARLVRAISYANECDGRDKTESTEYAFQEYLRVCPNVNSITYCTREHYYNESFSGKADAIVRAVLTATPPLREFTILHLESNLAPEFLKAYPDLNTLGVIISRWRGDETYPPAASWPANLTTLKIEADAISQTAFDTIITNSSGTITSLSFCNPIPRNIFFRPTDLRTLTALTALTTLTLKGVVIHDVTPLLSTCKKLECLLIQLKHEHDVRELLDVVPSTVHFLGLRLGSRSSWFTIPLDAIRRHILASMSPLPREMWISPAEIAQDESAQVEWEALVAAGVAKGVAVQRKDWEEKKKEFREGSVEVQDAR